MALLPVRRRHDQLRHCEREDAPDSVEYVAARRMDEDEVSDVVWQPITEHRRSGSLDLKFLYGEFRQRLQIGSMDKVSLIPERMEKAEYVVGSLSIMASLRFHNDSWFGPLENAN